MKSKWSQRKHFLAKQRSVISGYKRREAPTERDQSTAKRSRKLSKRQISICLGGSEDKQLLTEQLTNAQNMVKKLRTENLNLKTKLGNTEQNEELKTTVKRLQQEQFSFSNLINPLTPE